MGASMLDYIPGAVAFAAAVLATFGGDTTHKSQRGLRRLTRVRWLAIILAVIALGAGIVVTHRSQQALAEQERQRNVLRSIADTEVRLALHTLTQWFFMLVGDDDSESRFVLVS
jgi:hypothetical protein